MLRSIDCTYTEQGPDRSRFSYSISATVYQPAPEDVMLDKAIEEFAAISASGRHLRGPESYGGNPSNARSDRGRIKEEPYPGSYAGSMANSQYSLTARPSDHVRFGYPRMHEMRGPGASYRPQHNSIQYVDLSNDKQALVRYTRSKPDGRDDDMSIVPEDSISQISSSCYSRSEQRGRARRRQDEGSRFSGSRAELGAAPSGTGYSPLGLYNVDGSREREYYTRDITPWQ